MTVEISRKDLTVAELRAAAGKAMASRSARRMLAIALVLEGADRAAAAVACGMDRQTLRGEEGKKTVRGTVFPANGHRRNAEGLATRRSPGAKPLLTSGQKAELAALVEAGPDPERDGVLRWRRIDLQARIKTRFGVDMHERTVGKQLAGLGFRRLSVRPQHPKTDEGAQEAFKKTLPKR